MTSNFRGSYSTPIIQGLTPYTAIGTARRPGDKSDWPPYIDHERLGAYQDLEALVENRPWDVGMFEDLRLAPGQQNKIILALALPELLCNVWADALWTDPPEVAFRSDATRETWDAMFAAWGGEEAAWESVFGTAFSGTSVLRLRRDESLQDEFGTNVAIEEISPGIYFPQLRAGSARQVEWVCLAWEEDRASLNDDRHDLWEVKEEHSLEDGQYVIRYLERPKGTGREGFRPAARGLEGATEERPAGVDFLPFVEMHAKRWRGRYWGLSELSRNLGVFDQVDNTLSNIAEILEYHGKPVLQVPASVLYGGLLYKGADRVIGIRNPADKDTAKYITYDGQIDAQVKFLETLLADAFLVSEVSPTYFDRLTGGNADSGVAMKLRLQNYLKKATRYQQKETARLKRLADYALRLAGVTSEEDRNATVTHGSPLPADDVQDATIEQGLYGSGLSSRKTSIKRLRRVDDVDEEIKAIETEEAASAQGKEPPAPGAPGATQPGATARAGAALTRMSDETVRTRVEAVGGLIRAGFDPVASADALGLGSIQHTGAMPVTLRDEPPAVAEGGDVVKEETEAPAGNPEPPPPAAPGQPAPVPPGPPQPPTPAP